MVALTLDNHLAQNKMIGGRMSREDTMTDNEELDFQIAILILIVSMIGFAGGLLLGYIKWGIL